MKNPKIPVALTLTTEGRGGIRAVVDTLERDGLFERWNMCILYTHVEGSLFKRLFAAFKALIQFVTFLVFRRVSFVHCHVAMKGSFWRKTLFSRLALLFGVPVVFHLHGSEMKKFYSRQPKFIQKIISNQLAQVTSVVVLSDSWREFVHQISPRASITVVPNYICPPPIQECGKAHDGIRVVFLGLLGERKGIYDLLNAFASIAPSVPNMQLFVGGNGEVDEVTVAVAKLELQSQVHVLGWVSGNQKISLLESGDIYVLPSYNEGLPVSILEAMSWGLPIISTTVGGIPQLVRDKVDGLLIEPGDTAALAKALLLLGLDSTYRQQLGQSARGHVEKHFSRDSALPKLEGIYARLAGK